MKISGMDSPVSRSITGLRHIANRYDGFILDLWGVIHDGLNCYPGAVDCLRQLRASEKRIVFLSNAPRRERFTTNQLATLGIDASLYDAVVTSGETTRLCLANSLWRQQRQLGERYYRVGPELEVNILEDTGLHTVSSIGDADFLLLIGPVDYEKPVTWYDPILKEAAERQLPLVCANPDLKITRIDGIELLCAGTIAAHYNGTVHHIGKPYAEVYERAMKILTLPKENILAAGDNPDTDIPGATAMGIDSLLVLGGILKNNLPETANLQHNYYMKTFSW